MARPCTICGHPERVTIDARVASGTSLRGLSRYFRVSEDALSRHKRHIPEALIEAAKSSEKVAAVLRAESVVKKIEALENDACRLQAVAEGQGDTRAALVAVRERRETAAFRAKLVPVGDGGQTLLGSPELQATLTALLDALAPFPEARVAAAEVLRRRAAVALPEATPPLALSAAPGESSEEQA